MLERLMSPRVRSAAFWAVVGLGAVLALTFVDAGVWQRDWTVAKAASLLCALAIMAAAVPGFGMTWRMILDGLAGHRVRGAVRVFVYTWLARYVPGTVPYHTARLLRADAMGVSRGQVMASIGYEAVLILGMAGFAGAVCLIVGTGLQTGNTLLYVMGGVLLAALPFGLHPVILVPCANRLLKLAGRSALAPGAALSSRQTLAVALAYGGILLANGVAFYLITRVVSPEPPNLFLAIGAYCLAGAAGIAAPFVPSGLGVREAVLVALLAGTMPADSIVAVAATARAMTIVADILPPATLAGFDVITGSRSSTRRRMPVAAEPAGLEAGRG